LVDPRMDYSRIVLFSNDQPVAPEPLKQMPPPSPARAAVTAWQPGRMTVTLDPPPPAASYVLIAENWYPDWRATVDAAPSLVPRVLAQDPRLEILLVDDNSPDGTGLLADAVATKEPRLHVLHRDGKLGLGTAYLTGFRWALDRGYDYIFEMDADFSHDPVHLKDFLSTICRADLVLGSRYLNGKVTVVNWPMGRLVLSYCANIYARWLTGLRIWDLTGGFK